MSLTLLKMLIQMKGIGKLAYNSFPSSHEDFELDGDSTSNG